MDLEKRKEQKAGKKRKRLLFRIGILAVLVGAVIFALVSSFQKDKMVYGAGDLAPDFKLNQINPNNSLDSIQLADLKGKGVMLNFWATYCPPCEEEMPYMQNVYQEYREKGIEIVSVNLDSTEPVVQNFIKEYGLDFPVLRDSDGSVRELYTVGPIPSTVFIDADGKIVRRVEGALTLENLKSYFKEIQP